MNHALSNYWSISSLVEQIIVRETEIEIEFKCGVTIRQEYVR